MKNASAAKPAARNNNRRKTVAVSIKIRNTEIELPPELSMRLRRLAKAKGKPVDEIVNGLLAEHAAACERRKTRIAFIPVFFAAGC